MEDVGPDLFVRCAANLNNVTWEEIVCIFFCSRMVELFCSFCCRTFRSKRSIPKKMRVCKHGFPHARKFRYHGCVEMELLAFKFCGFVTALLFEFHLVTCAKIKAGIPVWRHWKDERGKEHHAAQCNFNVLINISFGAGIFADTCGMGDYQVFHHPGGSFATYICDCCF